MRGPRNTPTARDEVALPTEILNFIGGEFCAARGRGVLENTNPSTGRVSGTLPDSDAADVDAAVRVAHEALPKWRALGTERRAEILDSAAHLLEQRLVTFARAESGDQGKTVTLARTLDIPRAVANFRFFAGAIRHHSEQATQIDGHALNFTLRRPVGVAGLITPWNLPLYLLTWKIAPALAMGNTVVCKPSELTPLTAFMLCDVLREAGLPDGVANMVFGLGHKAGARIAAHADIPLISFTGGTATGRHIAAAAAPHFKKVSLELGGKNPNIIFADADLAQSVATTVRSSFLNQGEICLCGSRIFVERAIYAPFMERFLAETGKLVVGDPSHERTTVGALVSAEHRAKVESYIALAQKDGGRIEAGGRRPDLPAPFSSGFFLEPTILSGLPPDSRVMREEIFGPVVTVTPFDAEDEVVRLANETRYGLSASLWTSDVKRALRVAQEIDAGTVWVNGWLVRDLRVPFGGVKDSGLGREGGAHSLEFYSEVKNVCIRY